MAEGRRVEVERAKSNPAGERGGKRVGAGRPKDGEQKNQSVANTLIGVAPAHGSTNAATKLRRIARKAQVEAARANPTAEKPGAKKGHKGANQHTAIVADSANSSARPGSDAAETKLRRIAREAQRGVPEAEAALVAYEAGGWIDLLPVADDIKDE